MSNYIYIYYEITKSLFIILVDTNQWELTEPPTDIKNKTSSTNKTTHEAINVKFMDAIIAPN